MLSARHADGRSTVPRGSLGLHVLPEARAKSDTPSAWMIVLFEDDPGDRSRAGRAPGQAQPSRIPYRAAFWPSTMPGPVATASHLAVRAPDQRSIYLHHDRRPAVPTPRPPPDRNAASGQRVNTSISAETRAASPDSLERRARRIHAGTLIVLTPSCTSGRA